MRRIEPIPVDDPIVTASVEDIKKSWAPTPREKLAPTPFAQFAKSIIDEDAKRPAPMITNICVPGYKESLKIGVIPDTQCKPGVPLDHLYWAGRYLAEKRCDVIVHLGDHWDMVSLNIYEKGLKKAEGRTYAADVAAGNEGMRLFKKGLADGSPHPCDTPYEPRLVFLFGNHEERILRAIQTDPKLEGTIGYDDLDLDGWEVHQFLEVVKIQGIQFSHYFTSGAKGLAVSSAASLLRERQGSAIQGHNQVYQIAMHPKMGTRAIFAGAFYQHYEEYMGPQGNDHKRHLLVLHQAKDGDFDLMEVSLEFLRKRYS